MLRKFSTGRVCCRKRTATEAVLDSMMFSPTTSDSYRNNDPMMHTSPEDTHHNMIL